MKDRRANNGGARTGAGRPAESIKIELTPKLKERLAAVYKLRNQKVNCWDNEGIIIDILMSGLWQEIHKEV